MPYRAIQVSQGLVTSRDPSLLAEGEVSRADDSEYLPNDPALHRVGGRSAATTTAESGPIKGIAYCEFDGANDKLIVHVNQSYRISDAAQGGLSFSDLVTGLVGGETLDSAYFSNKFYLFNGRDRGYEASSDSTAQLLGMLENTTAPSLSRDAGVGTGFTLTSGSTITYWVEERVKSGTSILKRNASLSTTVVTLTGDGTLDKPVITRPAIRNSEATHWALFATATNSSFPAGAEIAEVVIATTTIEDTRVGTDPAIPSGTIYETWSADIFGATILVARNSPPPIASTSTIFEDSLVLNDASDLSKIWYSWPAEPHKFPSQNFVDFPQADEVTAVRRLGGMLIVLLRDSIWRLTFLPRPEDAEFDRGRVKEEVEGAHGCVGPKAAEVFNFGEGARLAYVSRYGLLITDGYTWSVLSGDLDWDSAFNLSKLDLCHLKNNPGKYRLELYGPSPGSNTNDVAYFFHYHPSHIKEGSLAKVTGPIHRPATCSEKMHFNGLDFFLTGAHEGNVYVGDTPNIEPLASRAGSVRTPDIYLSSFGRESKVIRLWAHHPAFPGHFANLIHISRNEGHDDTTRSVSIDLSRREPTGISYLGQAEAFQFGFDDDSQTGTSAINYFVVEYDFLGATNEP